MIFYYFPRCDVTSSDDWTRLWDSTESFFSSKVTLLVNNAGVNPQHGWRVCQDIMLTGVSIGSFMALERMGTSKVNLLF